MTNNFSEKYFLRKGVNFHKFWKNYLSSSQKNILFIMGLGFDPRTLNCFKIIRDNISTSKITNMVIQYDDDFKDRILLGQSLQYNITELESLMPRKNWLVKPIKMMSGSEHIMSVESSKILVKSEFSEYTDIVIDVSSMPIGVYFPIIRTLLDWINFNKIHQKDGKKLNLHVVVSENASFDGKILSLGMHDKVTFMHKFGKILQSEAKKSLRRVWIPVLGENQKDQLNKINQEMSPKEVCPVFPNPSTDPYRTKNLLLEYRELLFDTLDIDSRNFIYSTENNPFETFRRIYETAHHYYEAFDPLDGCNVVISPLSSKLLCIGALLAAHELLTEGSNIGIAHVENQTYDLVAGLDLNSVRKNSIPYTMWLTGEVYE